MLGEGGTALSEFEAAARRFLERQERQVDMEAYREITDALKVELALAIAAADEGKADL
jgi:hypothetical protein